MARIIKSEFTPELTLNLFTLFKDGHTDAKQLKVDDMVTDLRYVKDKAIAKVSGRVSELTYNRENTDLKRYYTSPAKMKSYFRYDIVPKDIQVDSSEAFYSHLTDIPFRELIEDAGEEDVARIYGYYSYAINCKVTLSDGVVNEFYIAEGDTLEGITYLYQGGESVFPHAKVVAITYNSYTLAPNALQTIQNGMVKTFNVLQLINVDGRTTPVADTTDIADAIRNLEGNILDLEPGNFTDPFSATKSPLLITGAKQGVRATLSSRDKVNYEGETVISGTITVPDGADLTLDGVTLSGNCNIKFTGSGKITLKNCIVDDIIPQNERDFFMHTSNKDEQQLIQVSQCYFGAYNKDSGKRIHNLFELYGQVADGSFFNNNYFEKGSCYNNDICIYNTADNAVIKVDGNTWEYSGNAVRVGTIEDCNCTVYVTNNTYNETDMSGKAEYAGILLVQPYAKATDSMANVLIYVNGNKGPSGDYHPYYIWANPKYDTVLEWDQLPTIILNNVTMKKNQWYTVVGQPTPVDPDEHFPDYEGDITDEEINELLDDDTSEGGQDDENSVPANDVDPSTITGDDDENNTETPTTEPTTEPQNTEPETPVTEPEQPTEPEVTEPVTENP